MKNVILAVTIILAFVVQMSAQNDLKEYLSEARTSENFHFISINGEMNVKIVQNEIPGVTVRGSKFMVMNTITMLKNDTLFVYQTNTRKGEKVSLIICADNIGNLQVSGKTKVDCLDLRNSDNLNMKVKDCAQIRVVNASEKVKSKIVS
jgi:hypothetical protein